MSERIKLGSVPGALAAMRGMQAYVTASGFDPALVTLIKIRASQINGCAYCLHMHVAEGRKSGETNDRLDTIATWREAPFFSSRERAALAWTESVTEPMKDGISDGLYEEVKAVFSEKEIADLTFAIVTINSWNRLMLAFRTPVKTTL